MFNLIKKLKNSVKMKNQTDFYSNRNEMSTQANFI